MDGSGGHWKEPHVVGSLDWAEAVETRVTELERTLAHLHRTLAAAGGFIAAALQPAPEDSQEVSGTAAATRPYVTD